MKKTLFILAHLDDEALSCGGLIQKRLNEGVQVHILILYSRKYNYGKGDQKQAEQWNHFISAITALGLEEENTRYAGLEEGEPHRVGYYPTLSWIEETLSTVQPDEVIIPSEKDLNQDHRFLHDACRIALRPANLGAVKRVLAAHAHDGGLPEGANVFVELTHTELLIKQKAVNCYTTESRPYPHPRSLSMLEYHARMVGSKIGVTFAEPYTLITQRE